MALTEDDKDEIRHIVQQEIVKAFDAAVKGALKHTNPNNFTLSDSEAKEKQTRDKLISEIGATIRRALRDVEDEANARIVEKTDPKRAHVIRNFKGEF